MNLLEMIPAAYRKVAYVGYAVIGIVLGAIQLVTGDIGWVIDALAVYGFVGSAVGLTAVANTPATSTQKVTVTKTVEGE